MNKDKEIKSNKRKHKPNKKEKICMIIVFIIGSYIGFNIGLEESIHLIFGLIIGFFIGKLINLNSSPKSKDLEDLEWEHGDEVNIENCEKKLK